MRLVEMREGENKSGGGDEEWRREGAEHYHRGFNEASAHKA